MYCEVSFHLFSVETEFFLNDFKNNMFCHLGAGLCPKHGVKMTHAQFIKLPYMYLYITLYSLFCLSPGINFKTVPYHLTFHLLTTG